MLRALIFALNSIVVVSASAERDLSAAQITRTPNAEIYFECVETSASGSILLKGMDGDSTSIRKRMYNLDRRIAIEGAKVEALETYDRATKIYDDRRIPRAEIGSFRIEVSPLAEDLSKGKISSDVTARLTRFVLSEVKSSPRAQKLTSFIFHAIWDGKVVFEERLAPEDIVLARSSPTELDFALAPRALQRIKNQLEALSVPIDQTRSKLSAFTDGSDHAVASSKLSLGETRALLKVSGPGFSRSALKACVALLKKLLP